MVEIKTLSFLTNITNHLFYVYIFDIKKIKYENELLYIKNNIEILKVELKSQFSVGST